MGSKKREAESHYVGKVAFIVRGDLTLGAFSDIWDAMVEAGQKHGMVVVFTELPKKEKGEG